APGVQLVVVVDQRPEDRPHVVVLGGFSHRLRLFPVKILGRAEGDADLVGADAVEHERLNLVGALLVLLDEGVEAECGLRLLCHVSYLVVVVVSVLVRFEPDLTSRHPSNRRRTLSASLRATAVLPPRSNFTVCCFSAIILPSARSNYGGDSPGRGEALPSPPGEWSVSRPCSPDRSPCRRAG